MDFRCPICGRDHPRDETLGFRCLRRLYLRTIRQHRLGGPKGGRRYREGDEMLPGQENALRNWEDGD